jgi:hypothetical protein
MLLSMSFLAGHVEFAVLKIHFIELLLGVYSPKFANFACKPKSR